MRTRMMGWFVVLVMVASAAAAACGDGIDTNALTNGRQPRPGEPGYEDPAGTDPNAPGSQPGTTPASTPGAPPPAGAGIPCDLQAMLADKCLACHSNPPSPGALSPTVTVADMLAASKEEPTKTVAQVSLERMQNAVSPMPPKSFNKPPTAGDISMLQAWIAGNYQGSCTNPGPPPPPPGPLTCTSCHGDDARVGIAGADANLKVAPPKGTKGETATSARAVGAHQAHLNSNKFSTNPIQCNECHVLPTNNLHANNVVDLTFGTLAKTGGRTPAFNGTTCTGSYCHGAFTGGSNAAPAWTGGTMTCTSCHGAPPATGDHQRGDHRGLPCSDCHGTGYSTTAVNKALHINGVKNAGGAGSKITYNAATRSCSPTCHGNETW